MTEFLLVFVRRLCSLASAYQHALEQLEVQRIRRIKEFEEGYLRESQMKYVQLKQRRQSVYRNEKEISRNKRDYAIAKQK